MVTLNRNEVVTLNWKTVVNITEFYTYTFEYSEGLGNMLVFKDINTDEDDYHSGKLDRGWEY